ncbi:MAG: hypothetical protein FJ272_23260, partial [Planctomycetes bacterium]|nr:hypothetical protein [Planctomycetota bacterium]
MRDLSLLCALVAACAAAHADRLLLDPARETLYWTANTGSEFPGATAKVEAVADAERGPCVRGEFEFSGESRYAGLEWRGTIEQGKALGFWVHLRDRTNGLLRVKDATDQWLATTFTGQRGAWTHFEIPLAPNSFTSHWAGANDGQLHFPLRAVVIAPWRGPDRQEMRLSNLYVESEPSRPEDRWQLILKPSAPSGVALQGEPVECSVRVVNRVAKDARCQLAVERQAPAGEAMPLTARDVALGPWEHKDFIFGLPSDALGYWRLRAEFRDLFVTVGGYAVVPKPRHYGAPAADPYFGLQIIQDLEAAERLGAKAVRQFIFWKYTE